MTQDNWQTLGQIEPTQLVAARLALHYAAQPMAASAYAVLPMSEDHSHTNILWSEEHGAFLGRPLGAGCQLVLDPRALRVTLAGREDTVMELRGQTLAEALEATTHALRAEGFELSSSLSLPEYDLPDAPLAHGASFDADPEALSELAAWFHNAQGELASLSQELLGGAEVRGWPHHFDLAVLHTVRAHEDPEQASSVGVGFSPGDGSYAEPYFYVSPWPYPDPASLPRLIEGAHWHTEGFTAAVLKASGVVDHSGGSEQCRLVRSFLRQAVEGSLELVRDV